MASRTIEIPFPGLFGNRDEDSTSTLQAAEEARRRPNPPLRRYVWSQHHDVGFCSRVNHATTVVQCDGTNYLYSVGGFHKEAPEVETLAQKKVPAGEAPPTEEHHHFNTGPIDIQRLNIGKPRPLI